MIVVIDYNVGNVKSVCNAFRHIGCEVNLSCEPGIIESAAGLVLPGVAAFGYAVSALGSLAELIKKVTLSGKPLLGICVGHQLLFDRSSEYGRHDGLELVRGEVVPIPPTQTVPHNSNPNRHMKLNFIFLCFFVSFSIFFSFHTFDFCLYGDFWPF